MTKFNPDSINKVQRSINNISPAVFDPKKNVVYQAGKDTSEILNLLANQSKATECENAKQRMRFVISTTLSIIAIIIAGIAAFASLFSLHLL